MAQNFSIFFKLNVSTLSSSKLSSSKPSISSGTISSRVLFLRFLRKILAGAPSIAILIATAASLTACGEKSPALRSADLTFSQKETPVYISNCEIVQSAVVQSAAHSPPGPAGTFVHAVADSVTPISYRRTITLPSAEAREEEGALSCVSELHCLGKPFLAESLLKVQSEYFTGASCEAESLAYTLLENYLNPVAGSLTETGANELDLQFSHLSIRFHSLEALEYARTAESGAPLCGGSWNLGEKRLLTRENCEAVELPRGRILNLPSQGQIVHTLWLKGARSLRWGMGFPSTRVEDRAPELDSITHRRISR